MNSLRWECTDVEGRCSGSNWKINASVRIDTFAEEVAFSFVLSHSTVCAEIHREVVFIPPTFVLNERVFAIRNRSFVLLMVSTRRLERSEAGGNALSVFLVDCVDIWRESFCVQRVREGKR